MQQSRRSFILSAKKPGSSLSILILGQDDVKHRHISKDDHKLNEWFASVEAEAWRAVTNLEKENRPDEIFLVTGQTLTSQYDRYHITTADDYVELSHLDQDDIPSPEMLDAKSLFDCDAEICVNAACRRETPKIALGRNETLRRASSVILEVRPSKPMMPLHYEQFLEKAFG